MWECAPRIWFEGGGVRSAKSFGSSVFTVFVCVCGLCVSLSLTLCMFRVLVGVCGCVGA